MTLSKDIRVRLLPSSQQPLLTQSARAQNHAKSTSHPPELVLNHFSTPLGLSLASLLSHLFLPPSTAEVLAAQGYQGRQVVLAQNSRDFVFIRRYRYMFALKSHALGSKKKVGLERQGPANPDEDDTIKARFQEIGPRMTVKMRWIRRGALGETGDERQERERAEKGEEGGIVEGGEDEEGDIDINETGGTNEAAQDDDEAAEEKEAAKAIGLDDKDADGQPNFDFAAAAAEAEASRAAAGPSTATAKPAKPVKRPRTIPRKRKLPYHALLRPPPSPSPEPGYQESQPVPLPSKDGKIKESSLLSTVGKTWHAGKGEGGVREGKKRREWGWEVSFGFLGSGSGTKADQVRVRRRGCKSAGASSSFRSGWSLGWCEVLHCIELCAQSCDRSFVRSFVRGLQREAGWSRLSPGRLRFSKSCSCPLFGVADGAKRESKRKRTKLAGALPQLPSQRTESSACRAEVQQPSPASSHAHAPPAEQPKQKPPKKQKQTLPRPSLLVPTPCSLASPTEQTAKQRK